MEEGGEAGRETGQRTDLDSCLHVLSRKELLWMDISKGIANYVSLCLLSLSLPFLSLFILSLSLSLYVSLSLSVNVCMYTLLNVSL